MIGHALATGRYARKDRGEYLILGASSLYTTAGENDDLVRETDDALLMGNDDHSRIGALMKVAEGFGKLGKGPEVDSRLGLVEDHKGRITREYGCDLDTLYFTAGE